VTGSHTSAVSSTSQRTANDRVAQGADDSAEKGDQHQRQEIDPTNHHDEACTSDTCTGQMARIRGLALSGPSTHALRRGSFVGLRRRPRQRSSISSFGDRLATVPSTVHQHVGHRTTGALYDGGLSGDADENDRDRRHREPHLLRALQPRAPYRIVGPHNQGSGVVERRHWADPRAAQNYSRLEHGDANLRYDRAESSSTSCARFGQLGRRRLYSKQGDGEFVDGQDPPVNHDGKTFQVKGPLNVARSPRVTP